MNIDRWHLIDPQHAVIVEVALLDTAVPEGDFTEQRRTDAECDPALELRPHRVRIDDDSAIDGRDDALDAHFARRRDSDLRHLSDVAPERVQQRDAATASWR